MLVFIVFLLFSSQLLLLVVLAFLNRRLEWTSFTKFKAVNLDVLYFHLWLSFHLTNSLSFGQRSVLILISQWHNSITSLDIRNLSGVLIKWWYVLLSVLIAHHCAISFRLNFSWLHVSVVELLFLHLCLKWIDGILWVVQNTLDVMSVFCIFANCFLNFSLLFLCL